jgi:hypothetical protein
MKSVAIFYYSLTGNTEAAARAVASGLPADTQAHLIRVVPTDPRWQLKVPFVPMWRTFFGTLPPTSRGDAMSITTEPAEWPDADAVVIGSATWWDRTCLPMQNLLRMPRFRSYVAGKPTGIFAACRGFFRDNLHEVARAVASAGARIVARDRFTYTGGLIGTFLAFFALLRFGTPQKRWLGVNLPQYGFTQATLDRAKSFGGRFAVAASAGSQEREAHPRLIQALRLLFLGLALFDLVLATAFTFFADKAVPLVAPAGYAQPLFFQRCVGLFLFQYVFVQFLGFRDPRRFATALTMTVAVRATFAAMYVAELILWGTPFTVLHGLFAASAVLDAATTVFVLWAMGRLDIGFMQGDSVAPPEVSSSKFLRLLLAVLAASELLIGLSWLVAPKYLCNMFGVGFAVDPFWTRATGMFLVNIAFIQYLGSTDANKYRSAAWTSGVFRSLWPVLYWIATAQGEGNGLFRFSIMFFSFFDLTTCITIFWLIHRLSATATAQPDQAVIAARPAAGA